MPNFRMSSENTNWNHYKRSLPNFQNDKNWDYVQNISVGKYFSLPIKVDPTI